MSDNHTDTMSIYILVYSSVVVATGWLQTTHTYIRIYVYIYIYIYIYVDRKN